jgi:PmbA protein
MDKKDKDCVEYLLEHACKKGCSAAEVSIARGEGLSVTVRMGQTEDLSFHCAQKIDLVVYKGQSKASASTSDLSSVALETLVDQAVFWAGQTEADPYAGLAENADLATQWGDLSLDHPWDLSSQEAIVLAHSLESQALAYDPRLKNSEGASISTNRSNFYYGTTAGFRGGYASTHYSMSCLLIAEDENGEMQQDGEYTVARKANSLQPLKALASSAAAKTLTRVGAKACATQDVPVLFHAPVARGLLGHFLGAITGGALYRKSSFLLDSLGKKIFPSWFSLYEDPFVQGGWGSAPFDAEGVQSQVGFLVEHGCLQHYLLSSYSARRLGLKNTGHAGGVHNLFAQTDDPKKQSSFFELVKDMKKGLLVTDLMGSGVNMVTGDYSRGASGFWVEGGEIQYPVQGVTIAGQLKEMYQGIVAMGTDVDQRGVLQNGSLLINHMMVAGS